MLDTVLIWAGKNEKRWIGDLKNWLGMASVSAQRERDGDTRAAGEWAMQNMRSLGMTVEMVETKRHPVVIGRTPEGMAPKRAPHVLLYGHYDVQPAEPLELWQTPPFEATVRDGKIFARGASDDKGQVHCHLAALTAWKEINADFPCRVTILLEGEEEIGSPNLMTVVNTYKDELKTADILLISDSNQFAQGVPAITYGLRGLVYFEIRVKGANSDLHSGQFGGGVANPAHVLVDVLGKLHDAATGRVTVPGFYDAVAAVTEEEKRGWDSLPFTDEEFMAGLGVKGLYGEVGYGTLERKWARPTLEIHGLTSGYQGAGAKTVLPALASAKVSCRLVPDQDPVVIAKSLMTYVDELAGPYGESVTVEVEELGTGSPGGMTPIKSAAMSAAIEAVEMGFGKKPVLVREGGSIPVVTWMKEALGVDTVMVGFGLPDDRIHAPNEKLDVACYTAGVKTAAALYWLLGERLKKG